MKKILQFVFVLFVTIQLQAQEKTITGVVSDENGIPLPSVTVLVKGTTSGTSTNFDGKYAITANVGDVLIFSYVGYATMQRTIGNIKIIDVHLQPDNTLDEVVVSALGFKRESKSLGYSVSSSLSGKAAGVSVSGAVGSSSRIVIRGSSYLKGSSKKKKIRQEPQYGQLTAGEINDLEKWEEWIKIVQENNYQKIQEDWGFYLENRVVVNVKDSNGTPLNNIKVLLHNASNEIVMIARTDMTGKAVLFKDLNNKEEENYFWVQLIQEGNIVGKKITNAHNEIEFVLNKQKESNDIDIMFTIDATGSMADEINYLKAELKNIITRLDKNIEQKRVALTFYRDKGDAYLVKDFDFNSNIDNVKEILSHQDAGGGGDYEEAVEEALKVSLQKNWNIDARAKLLFLLLDAPPHFTEENVTIIKNQIKLAQERGIKIIPIVASDADKNVEFLMRFFSISTNGTYVFLTDDSGIGNSHIAPTTDTFKVEKLNDLIVRLIEKYSGVIR